jgi:uncharacterized membrane protein
MEIVEQLENILAIFISYLAWLLEAIAALAILLGLLKTIQLALRFSHRQGIKFRFIKIRISFGTWLALALEFQLGADILATTISPSLEALIQVAAIAFIRTFLNYFLNKELETIYELQKSDGQELFESAE